MACSHRTLTGLGMGPGTYLRQSFHTGLGMGMGLGTGHIENLA